LGQRAIRFRVRRRWSWWWSGAGGCGSARVWKRARCAKCWGLSRRNHDLAAVGGASVPVHGAVRPTAKLRPAESAGRGEGLVWTRAGASVRVMQPAAGPDEGPVRRPGRVGAVDTYSFPFGSTDAREITSGEGGTRFGAGSGERKAAKTVCAAVAEQGTCSLQLQIQLGHGRRALTREVR